MPRPFAVIGMTVFFTLAVLNDTDIGAADTVFWLFLAALTAALLNKKVRAAKVLPCAFAAGAAACLLLFATNNLYYQPRLALSGMQVEARVCITDEAVMQYGNYYYNGKITELDGEKTDIKVRLTFSVPLEAEPYDTVSGEFSLFALGETEEKYLESYRSSGRYLGAIPEGEYTVTPRGSGFSAGAAIVKMRSAIKKAVLRAMPNDCGRLTVALLLGDKDDLPAKIQAAFAKIGITHIICVSGFHLSFWSMLILGFLKKIGIPHRLACVAAIFGTVLFMLISGMTYSVVRSGIMTVVFLFGDILFRKTDSFNSLGFSLTVIGVADPLAMGSVSLRLSALATAGIILCGDLVVPKVSEALRSRLPKNIAKPISNIAESLLQTGAAIAFTLPVAIQLYGTFNLMSFPANLLLTPAASPTMVLGALAALFGSVLNCFNPFAFLGNLFASYMVGGAKLMAMSDITELAVNEDQACAILFALFLLCAISVFFAYLGHSMPRLTAILCTAVFFVSVTGFSVSSDTQTRMVLADTGNGICLAISKNRENLLIGAGGSGFKGNFAVKDALGDMNGSLKAIFVPDGDTEYAGFLVTVLTETRPEEIYCDSLPDGGELLLSGTQRYSFEQNVKFENFTVRSYRTETGCAVYIKTEDASCLVCLDPNADIASLPVKARKADVLVTRGDYPENVSEYGFKCVVVAATNARGVTLENELKALGINSAATADCGNIEIRSRKGYTALGRR